MKRLSALLVVICVMISGSLCVCENTYVNDWNVEWDESTCDLGNYTCTAVGGWDDFEASWEPQWYTISVTDRQTETTTMITEKLYGSVILLPLDEVVYVYQDILSDFVVDYDCMKVDIYFWRLNCEHGEMTLVYSEENANYTDSGIRAFCRYRDRYIYITDYDVYLLDMKTFEKEGICHLDAMSENGTVSNLPFIYDDGLVLSDVLCRIMTINLETGELTILVDDACGDYFSQHNYSPYEYIIIGQKLYYFSENVEKTVEYDLATKEKEYVADTMIGFDHVDSQTVYATAYYYETSSSKWGTYITVVNKTDLQLALENGQISPSAWDFVERTE